MARTRSAALIATLLSATLLLGACGLPRPALPAAAQGPAAWAGPAGPPAPASHNDGVLITAVYYDTAVAGEPDEAVRLHNPGAAAADLSGWRICDDDGPCAVLPDGAALPAGGFAWVAREAVAFAREWGFAPDYELVPSDPAVPDAGGGVPVLANAGDVVYLRDAAGRTVDTVVYGAAAPGPGDPWQGPPVPGQGGGRLLHRAFDEARLDAAGALDFLPDTDSAADWQQGDEWRTARTWRRGQPFLGLPSWTATGPLTAYAAPDGAFAVLAGLFDGAARRIDVQVYTFTSHPLYERLAAALARGVQVRMYLEGSPAGGMSDQGRWIATQLTRQGAQVMLAGAPGGGLRRYRFSHAKFGIIDGAKVFVQSENPGAAGTPADPSYGNRGWGVVVADAAAAAYFQSVFDADWRPGGPDTYLCGTGAPDPCSPPAGFAPDRAVPTGPYPHPYGPHTFTDTYTVTPVLAPDHALLRRRALRAALAAAHAEILAEHQYLHAYWGPPDCNPDDCPNLYLSDLIAAARRGVRVRVILGAAFLDPASPRDNTRTVAMLNGIAAREGLDLEARLEHPAASGLVKVHNKGFIIDGRQVLISSINGSENSPANNREAALLIESPAVAAYYRDIWHWNWHQGTDQGGNPQPPRDPVISEVLYDPPGDEARQEWVELHNPTGAAVDLTGWRLHDSAGSWPFPAGTVLAAGATLTVARDAAGFRALYGQAPDLAGLTLALDNGADALQLADPRGNGVSQVAWGGALPNWDLGAAEGASLARCPAGRDRFSRLDWAVDAAPSPGGIPARCHGS